jgi:V-type H+-transporting ATPase subunit a
MFGSKWAYPAAVNGSIALEAVPTGSSDTDIYPFGVDPAWRTADNELLFFNSLKMKMSVILGITQMMLGLGLKLANAIYFKSKVDLYFEAIPQIVFMLALFGYMIFLIVFKWAVDWRSAR